MHDVPGGAVEQLEHRQLGTRLGEGLRDGGYLAPAAIARTLAAATELAAVARSYGATLACIATSAVRRADDGIAFGERIFAATGVPLRVLSGEEEAAASYRGATYGVPHESRRIAVLDIGGGSTECAVGCNGSLLETRSIEIGSIRVAEQFPALLGADPGEAAHEAARVARVEIALALDSLGSLGPIAEVRCVAGTPLTIAAIIAGSHVDKVSGSILSREALDATIVRLLDLHVDERRVLAGMLAQRADIIVGGALVLSEAMRELGVTEGLVESRDLLLGFLLTPQRLECEPTK